MCRRQCRRACLSVCLRRNLHPIHTESFDTNKFQYTSTWSQKYTNTESIDTNNFHLTYETRAACLVLLLRQLPPGPAQSPRFPTRRSRHSLRGAPPVVIAHCFDSYVE